MLLSTEWKDFSNCLSLLYLPARLPLLRPLCPVWPPDTERYDHIHTHTHTLSIELQKRCAFTKIEAFTMSVLNAILAEVGGRLTVYPLVHSVCIQRSVCAVCVFVSVSSANVSHNKTPWCNCSVHRHPHKHRITAHMPSDIWSSLLPLSSLSVFLPLWFTFYSWSHKQKHFNQWITKVFHLLVISHINWVLIECVVVKVI